MIHLLMALPTIAAGGAEEIAAQTGIEVDFVRSAVAESAAKTAKPR